MAKIIVLSSDTPHHRYFINFLEQAGLPLAAYLFETEHAKAPFPTGPLFEEQELAFENANFFNNLPWDLPKNKVHFGSRINSPESLALLKEWQPDLGIVFGTGKLSPAVIRSFRDGLINVHRGITESYRGLDSDLWAIYHGDYDKLGVTIHRVAEALDTGSIVYQQRMPLKPGMRAWQIRYYTTIIATELVAQALQSYLAGKLPEQPQETQGRYYSFMPLDLKKIVANRFDDYCEALHA